jgi:hypothetical protein
MQMEYNNTVKCIYISFVLIHIDVLMVRRKGHPAYFLILTRTHAGSAHGFRKKPATLTSMSGKFEPAIIANEIKQFTKPS